MPPEEQVIDKAAENVDSDASFAAGFSRTRGDTPTPSEPPKQEKATEPPKGDADTGPVIEEKKSEAPPADEWKDVHPKVKAELESMRGTIGELGKLPGHVRNIQHQIGGLMTFTQDMKAAMAKATTATQATGAATPSKEQVEAAAKSDARWKQLAEDFPEWAEAVDERLKAVETNKPAPVDTSALKTDVLGEVDSRIAKARDEARTQARAEARTLARIDNAFPDTDWEADIKSEQFATWYEAQKPEVQALSKSAAAQDAIKLIRLYKDGQAQAAKAAEEKAEKQRRLERAATPKGVAHEATPSLPSEDESFARGFSRGRGQ